jgi:hypothetical protein
MEGLEVVFFAVPCKHEAAGMPHDGDVPDYERQAPPSGTDPGWAEAAETDEAILTLFAARQCRRPVTLTRFEVTIEGPGGVLVAAAEPAFYVTPARSRHQPILSQELA